MKKQLAVVLVSLMAVACNTTTPNTGSTAQPVTKNDPGPISEPAKDDTQGTTANAAAKDQSVYFGFQEASIAGEHNGVILDEAKLMKHAAEQATITLEGNCDERGSAEYNLGLGQRRADAVKKALVAAGVPAQQVRTVSEGKEKPKATCHDESCWKENRRVDFVQGGS